MTPDGRSVDPSDPARGVRPVVLVIDDDAGLRESFHLILDDDFEVIPIPGHTPGSTAYLWDTGSRRVLFTGDTILLRDGEWRTAVLDSSDRDAYRDSLLLIGELDFDVLVPWIASGPYHALTDRADTRRRIDALVERL